MKSINHYNSYEEFEAELARQLGLAHGFGLLREAVAKIRRPKQLTQTLAAVTTPQDLESRYRACKTTAQRLTFIRANRAEVNKILGLKNQLPVPITNSPKAHPANAKPTHRRLKCGT